MISDKKFLGFDFPPKMESFKPRQKKHYEHLAIVVSESQPDYAYVLKFSNDKKAKNHVRSALESESTIAAKYEKKELPVSTEEGIIL